MEPAELLDEVVVDRNQLLVVQSNKLVESSHSLTLSEKRLVILAAAMMDSRKEMPLDGVITIAASDFARHYELRGGQAYDALKDSAKRLYNRSIRSIEKTAKRGTKVTNVRWVWKCSYSAHEATVELGFSPEVMPYLTALNREFTKYRLSNVRHLSSFYGLRLYELCSQYRSIGSRTMTLEEFRDFMDLGDKYDKVNNLRARVLDPSVNEITELSDLDLSYVDTKRGRTVTGFEFIIAEKPGIALPAEVL